MTDFPRFIDFEKEVIFRQRKPQSKTTEVINWLSDVLILANIGVKVNTYKIDFTTMPIAEKVKVKRNDTTTDKPVNVQCGVAMLNVPAQAVEGTIQITFPKQFTTGTIPTVVCSFGGYGSPGEAWTDTPNSSWGGCAFSAVNVTNTSFTARCRRFDGAQLLGTYYVNWIAIG